MVGPGASIDGDNPDHMLWICDKAQERAEEYGIEGVDYRLTQGIDASHDTQACLLG